eukprot:CAMPEP_0168726498 /NCGR_PEP_ID=MMETSP0724-20121128/4698_1 /TAXON_ID=265536 /ORGANISM="Amphiprora sp., Strain CCMP467" /LENGTH=553 /DNA_ID=CAMNT_0008773311 /DNA_START=18 /DNA_END=1679 /DNA_ORIENTATION=+
MPLQRSFIDRSRNAIILPSNATAATASHRFLSSTSSSRNNNNNNNNRFQLYALPFSVSPNQALDKFLQWATVEQGLSSYMISRNTVQLSAAYCPVWSFDVNLRFVVNEYNDNNNISNNNKKTGKPRRRLDWKPQLFQVYGRQSVVHVPGLSAYAGYDYPRSLVNPLHNTTLVFFQDTAVPFGKWMLQDMTLQNESNNDEPDQVIPISPDPWTATQKRAFAILKEELTGISQEEGMDVEVQTEVIRARRVYMPTYVVDYQLFGVSFRAFLSGADARSDVSGPSHKLWDSSIDQHASQGLQGFLGQTLRAVQQSAQTIGGQRTLGILAVAAQFLGQVVSRVALRLPWIAAIVGGFIGFRKLLQPLIGSQLASAEWERQREHEANMADDHHVYQDDFTDSGAAQRFFRANKTRILQHLAGAEHHERGDYDFYKDWEEWARRTYQQQNQHQQQDYYNYQQQQQQQQRVYGQQQHQQQHQSKQKPEFQWDFNPNDPYSVLGIQRGASKQQVSAAFRREMLKYHPDTQGQASEAERIRSVERSKLISEAYRKIKTEMKG